MITKAYIEWNGLNGRCKADVDLSTLQLKTVQDEVETIIGRRKFKFFQRFRKVEYLPGGKRVKLPGIIRSESVIHLIVNSDNWKEIKEWFKRRDALQDYKHDMLLTVSDHSGGCPIAVQKLKVLGAWPNPVNGLFTEESDRIVLIHDDIRTEDGKCL